MGAGEYILTATNMENGEMKSYIIAVISVIKSGDLVKYYKNDSQFVVRIHTSDGGYVGAGEEVMFNINGILYTRTTNVTGHAKPNINGVLYNRVTGSDGIAKLNIRLQPGQYIITSSYNGFNIANKITISG